MVAMAWESLVRRETKSYGNGIGHLAGPEACLRMTFKRGDVDDAVVTTEPHIFHQKLRHVNLSGGQDCPEMTLTGIKKALEASLPGSFVFVFTDARSKDFHLIDSVLNLIQEKQTSVVFVMTGDCGDRNHTGYKVFDKIASASFGHVFHLQKSQVTQILAYVRESVSQRRVYLVFEDRLNGQSSTSEVPVDSHLHVLAVSLSLGKNEHDTGREKEFLEVSIVDPEGKEYTIDNFKNDNTSINLNSVKLFRIEKPMPGIWKVKTSSDNRNSLRIYGHGEVDFRYGFTTVKHDNQDILLAQSRPFANQNTYLWVNVTDVDAPGQIERISIVDYQGKEIFGSPAMVTSHNPNLYVVGPFLPPKGMHFFVRIEGVDEKDYKFVRIASTAVSSHVLSGPKASMLPTTPATLHQSVNLTCNIEASGPYEVTWKHNDRPLTSMPLYFAKSDTATWPISYVKREDAGQYLCVVTSKDGNHTAATVLDMFEPPPDIVSLRNASAVLNGPAIMHCQTQTAEPSFVWYRNGMPVPSGPATYTYSNGSLVIFNTRRIDAGAYVCQVTTRGGTANATIHLGIFEMPTAKIAPKDIFVVENSYFQLNCTATGVPLPRVRWFHQGAPIDFARNNAFALDRYNNLRVYSGTNVKGVFECRADNVAGTASDYSSVNLAERPIINIPKDEYVLGQGDNVVLECQVLRGQPTPRIHWERNGALFASEGDVSSKYIYQKYGNLHIRGASEIDAGDYTCVAENSAGKDSKTTRVNIV
uniref:VWA domain-containing protein n=1 Tax=Panagrellus redivivus TaxID=6233 RepID=A0A7E4UTM9_PANRE